jgi:hypothetical protein
MYQPILCRIFPTFCVQCTAHTKVHETSLHVADVQLVGREGRRASCGQQKDDPTWRELTSTQPFGQSDSAVGLFFRCLGHATSLLAGVNAQFMNVTEILYTVSFVCSVDAASAPSRK